MADKVLFCLLVLAAMLILTRGHSMAQLIGRGMKTTAQGKKICVQQNGAAQENKHRTYLNLELKISEGGSFKVTRAAEVPGSVRLNSAPTSDYIYEVSNGRQTVAAAFLRDDPFAARGFADPSSPQGEKIERQETATVIINIPAFSLSMLEKCKLGLRLYKLRPGVKVERMDADVLLQLREKGNLILVITLSSPKFTEAIKKAAAGRL